MSEAQHVCFFQASRFDSIASLMAAHGGSPSAVIELDADPDSKLPYLKVIEALFEAESVQSW